MRKHVEVGFVRVVVRNTPQLYFLSKICSCCNQIKL